MSLVEQPSLPAREPENSSQDQRADSSYTDSVPRPCEPAYSPSSETYDHAIFDSFYMEDDEVMGPKTAHKAAEVPALPARSALRASKLLDSFNLKMDGPPDTAEVSQTTFHDFYLSSEEDASSSADDFSDYDYDSASESAASPIARTSHEDTARVVSVVFSGRASIIDLSSIRRSISASSMEARRRARAESIVSTDSISKRPSTPASSISSVHPIRKTSMLSSILSNPKPTFLKIDPYANGSTYSLEPSKHLGDSDNGPKTPRTPTALLQGVTRTFSLVKKKSRPLLSNMAANRSKENLESSFLHDSDETSGPAEDETNSPSSVRGTKSRGTYGDIMRFVKRNNQASTEPTQAVQETAPTASPASPTETKKGLLGNLAARRRSIKSTTRLI